MTTISTAPKSTVAPMSKPAVPASAVSPSRAPPTASFRMPLRCRTQFQMLAITTGDSITG